MTEKIIQVDTMDQILTIFGDFDKTRHAIEEKYHVTLLNRGTVIKVTGEEQAAQGAAQAIEAMLRLTPQGENVGEQTIRYVTNMVAEGAMQDLKELAADAVAVTISGKPVRARTVGQKKYVEAIQDNTIVLGIGPAGTGKTYLAVAMAVKAFRAHAVSRIVLTRPAVEAGEKLGFLPGDLNQKVDPYLRPLYDAMFDMLGAETCQRMQERGVIEVAPLAYMRGRTLSDAFIILDEAQNTTTEQMKMFLTRMGFRSRIVVTGDPSQIDLPRGKRSGLIEAVEVLEGVEDISVQRLTHHDVVRHELVQAIVRAYDEHAARAKEEWSDGRYAQERPQMD